MTRLVVDSNVIFSAMLNINSRIGQLLLNGSKHYDFFAPDYVRTEILEHKTKIQSISKQSDNEFVETYEMVLKHVFILNLSLIPNIFFEKAYALCKDIDPDDVPFVAVSEFVRGRLWTGDKKLINGLHEKQYKRIVTTEELYQDFLKNEPKR